MSVPPHSQPAEPALRVTLARYRFSRGEPLEFTVAPLPLGNRSLQYTLARLDEEDTEFAQSGPAVTTSHDEGVRAHTEHVKDLRAGLYQLVKIEAVNATGDERAAYGPQVFGPVLFELVDGPTSDVDHRELIERAEKLLAERDAKFLAGLGDGLRRFSILVFVRDILLTRRMRVDGYEVIPFEGMQCNDELAIMQRFMERYQLGTLSSVPEVLASAQRGQPTFVVHFPCVRAADEAAAGALAEEEADRVTLVLTLHRGGAGAIFGSIVRELDNAQTWYRLHAPIYRGNLVGGGLSGEQPAVIRERTRAVRSSPRGLLYASLFREARRETNIEVQYFRYWSLLETIARSKNYVGSPKIDVYGRAVLNRRGKQQLIQDRAEDIVYELIRREVLHGGYEQPHVGTETHSVTDGLEIWYERRNCLVHGGQCACRGTNANPSSKQRACAEARRERDMSGQLDAELMTLRTVCEIALARELHHVASDPTAAPRTHQQNVVRSGGERNETPPSGEGMSM